MSTKFIEAFAWNGERIKHKAEHLNVKYIAKLSIEESIGDLPPQLHIAKMRDGSRYWIAEVDHARILHGDAVSEEPSGHSLLRIDISQRDRPRFEQVPIVAWLKGKPIARSLPPPAFDIMREPHVDPDEAHTAIVLENGRVLCSDEKLLPWARGGIAEEFDNVGIFVNVVRGLHSFNHYAPDYAARLGRRIRASRAGDASASRFDLSKFGA
ncbi:hypothetical protein [Methylosinus sp. RM1]|uniref:hypothetical protein n=1 Tax=Methylosinus sp. RM1 TaxID=2583817 RepID=UPI00140B7E8A|nr:hypothetical protein [Methylosinus sp. RM1]